MDKFFSDIKLSIFEVISFVLPGFAFLVLGSTLFPGYISLTDVFANLIPYTLLSYVLGLILHSLSVNEFFNWKQMGWKVYHRFKEKDAEGHGVKEPQTIRGRLSKAFRYKFLEVGPQKTLEVLAVETLKKRFGNKSLDNFDAYFVMEALFIQNDPLSKQFEHLHYQKVFARSLATVFLLYALATIAVSNFADFILYLGDKNPVEFKFLDRVVVIVSLLLYFLLLARANFYKLYRDKIMSVAVLLSDNTEITSTKFSGAPDEDLVTEKK